MMNSPALAGAPEGSCLIGIYLYGQSISVDDASNLLGLKPTKARNRGEIRVTSSGSEVVQKIGFWEFGLRTDIDGFKAAVARLLDGIKCPRVLGLAGIEKAELDVFVALDEGQVGFSFELPTNALRRLADLGFDLVVTSR